MYLLVVSDAMLHKIFEVLRGKCLAKQMALIERAPHSVKQSSSLLSFQTLGNNIDPETFRHRNNCFNYDGITGICNHVFDEHLIYFQLVDWKLD